jgi:RNA polymerase sigma-70 factor (ECF subfamily)
MSNTSPQCWDLGHYRPLLCLLARQLRLHPRLQVRFDASDLVQEALGQAHKRLAQFRGQTEPELIAWLQEVLRNTFVDRVRRELAQRRDVRQEVRAEDIARESSARLEDFLHDRAPAPPEQLALQEMLLRLAEAVERLPADQRDAVVLRDLEGLSVRDIAEQLGRTEKAVAGLLLRGRQRLREVFANES